MMLSASPWLCVRMVRLSRAGKQKDQCNIVAICQPIGGDATCSTFHHHACRARTTIDVRTVEPARLPTRPCLTCQPSLPPHMYGVFSCDMTTIVTYHSGRTRLVPGLYIKVLPWWSIYPARNLTSTTSMPTYFHQPRWKQVQFCRVNGYGYASESDLRVKKEVSLQLSEDNVWETGHCMSRKARLKMVERHEICLPKAIWMRLTSDTSLKLF